MTYEEIGPITLGQFKAMAAIAGTFVHTYLSDGDRGHRCWAFYYGSYKYVTDGLSYGRKLTTAPPRRGSYGNAADGRDV